MKDSFSKLIIIDTFFLIIGILLFFLDYEILASVIIILVFLFNIINYFLNGLKIKYIFIGKRKSIIYAIIDNQNVINLYYESGKNKEIINKVYKEIKNSFIFQVLLIKSN